jgi:hypothetical protein
LHERVPVGLYDLHQLRRHVQCDHLDGGVARTEGSLSFSLLSCS